MNGKLSIIDLAVLLGYLGLTVGIGCWFALRKRDSNEFMSANRSIPGWAVGLSMFGSYVSSISFLANPGKAFASNWNAFVFSLATPIAALVAIRWFVPFYRRGGSVSAYEHLEHRFGRWARTYAVVCFLLTQVLRTGMIMYLLAIAVQPMLGWPIWVIVLITGGLMILYTIFGGIEAAVWIGVLQSVVLLAGPMICLFYVLHKVPDGLPGVLKTATAGDLNKFSLGSFGPSMMQATFWVTLMYGLMINLSNFSVDQSYVQRYITTPTERQAKLSVLMTAGLYVPVAGFFFFIGTALFVLNATNPGLFPAATLEDPDKVFPYFISHMLPVGLGGLVVAAIFAASMDSTLSSIATLSLYDLYKPYVRPNADERESLLVLRGATLFWGIVAICVGLIMIRQRRALDTWWEWAGIFNGGMLSLFLLGMMSRATNPAAATSVVIGVCLILWMTVSRWANWPLPGLRFTWHASMITVIGTLTILLCGLLIQMVLPAYRDSKVKVPDSIA